MNAVVPTKVCMTRITTCIARIITCMARITTCMVKITTCVGKITTCMYCSLDIVVSFISRFTCLLLCTSFLISTGRIPGGKLLSGISTEIEELSLQYNKQAKITPTMRDNS